jgi:tRNA pseudouridine55 synthase
MVRWGSETDNDDLNGRVIFSGDASHLSPSKLESALAGFSGWHDQTPPAASAKRIGKERAYEKAHRGETVELAPCRVYLHEAEWLEHDLPRESRLRLTVRGGFYVRALARDLGKALGCGAHVSQLHRSSIGPWNDPGPGKNLHVQGRDVLPWAQSRALSDQDVGDLRQGRSIPLGRVEPGEWALPAGFPEADAPIRGFHLEKFAYLLKREDDALRLITPLRGGV